MTDTKTTHTPGPWRIERGEESRARTRIVQGVSGRGIAYIIRRGLPTDDVDACLIAAAPDLLAANDYARRYFRSLETLDPAAASVLADLDAAHAKAEGGAA